MLPTGFETAIPARERPQTHSLDRAATSIGIHYELDIVNITITKQRGLYEL